jgi:hypothetical protein
MFVAKMGVSDSLKELRVIRGKGVVDEFGEGLAQEKPVDEMAPRARMTCVTSC